MEIGPRIDFVVRCPLFYALGLFAFFRWQILQTNGIQASGYLSTLCIYTDLTPNGLQGRPRLTFKNHTPSPEESSHSKTCRKSFPSRFCLRWGRKIFMGGELSWAVGRSFSKKSPKKCFLGKMQNKLQDMKQPNNCLPV